MRGANFPSFEQLDNWSVNRSGDYEVIHQSLYDFQTYAQAGQTSLNFFSLPKGQSGKTIADTNLTLAGVLPAPIHFVVQSLEVYFIPAPLPVTVETAADLTVVVPDYTNDVFEVWESGSLDFTIGSKSYLQEAPIGRFPQKTRINVDTSSALQTKQAIAADQHWTLSSDYAAFSGRPYWIDPWLLLVPTQNFSVELIWPAAVAISASARIGIVMDGLLYRLSQ